MEISPLALSILLISTFLWGGIIGIINDVNKIIRLFLYGETFYERHKKMVDFFKLKVNKKKRVIFNKTFLKVLVFIQDVLLLIIGTLGLILLNYYYNDGFFRLFTFWAMLIGFAVYYFIIGKLVMVILEPLAFFVRCFIVTVFRFIIFPIRLLLESIRNLILKLFVKCKISIEKNKNLRYNKRRRELVIKLSENGFL